MYIIICYNLTEVYRLCLARVTSVDTTSKWVVGKVNSVREVSINRISQVLYTCSLRSGFAQKAYNGFAQKASYDINTTTHSGC